MSETPFYVNPCGHGALIDGDDNCPDCGAPVIYRARSTDEGLPRPGPRLLVEDPEYPDFECYCGDGDPGTDGVCRGCNRRSGVGVMSGRRAPMNETLNAQTMAETLAMIEERIEIHTPEQAREHAASYLPQAEEIVRVYATLEAARSTDGLREAAIAVLDSWERGDIDHDYDRFASTYDCLRAALGDKP